MPAFQDNWPRWRQVESVATSRGALCFGPDRGRRTTYTSPSRWLPGFRPAQADDALAAMVRAGHGFGLARAILELPPGAELNIEQLSEHNRLTDV